MEEKIIIRQIYLNKIAPFIGKQIIKVLTGQRRVGKSYVLLQTIEYIKNLDKSANILYINKEDLAFDAIKTATDLNDFVLHGQQCPHSFKRTFYLFKWALH